MEELDREIDKRLDSVLVASQKRELELENRLKSAERKLSEREAMLETVTEANLQYKKQLYGVTIVKID